MVKSAGHILDMQDAERRITAFGHEWYLQLALQNRLGVVQHPIDGVRRVAVAVGDQRR
jgi:hypothetical protein